MRYSARTKQQARQLRLAGKSIPEIAKELGIAKSTVSLWLRGIALPLPALEMIRNMRLKGQEKGRLMVAARKEHVQKQRMNAADELAATYVAKMSTGSWEMIAALLFWCEGSKQLSGGIHFTNSDPQLVRVFLTALRQGFKVNESRLRCLLHVHEYHDEKEMVRYWSEVTGIPSSKFYRSYLKPHTGARKHPDYRGCLSIRYADANLAKILLSLYNAFAKNIGAW